MTIEELQNKYDESNKKVFKRLNIVNKLIAADPNKLDGLLDDFMKLITNTKGEIVSCSLMPLNIKYFPENPHEYANEGDIMENLCKLRDLMVVNFNWKVKLDKAKNEENKEKVEVIWSFLQKWKLSARDYILKEAHRYIDLIKECEEKFAEYTDTEEYKAEVASYKYDGKYKAEINFKKNFFLQYPVVQSLAKSITKLYPKRDFDTKKVISWEEKIDEDLLDKTLDKEVKIKYNDLIERITSVVGTIQDAEGLYISDNNEINGIVVGSKGKAKVETIGAGGWNIVSFHYRTLVHKID